MLDAILIETVSKWELYSIHETLPFWLGLFLIFVLRRRNGPITKLQAPPWTRKELVKQS